MVHPWFGMLEMENMDRRAGLIDCKVIECSQETILAKEKVVTLRFDGALTEKLDTMATATRRSRSFLAAEAIRDYVALNSWQMEEIQKGLEEADRGEFASEQKLKQMAKK